MNNLHGSEFEQAKSLRASEKCCSPALISPATCLLSQIPPERIGLNGEYDHAGLAKRVRAAVMRKLGVETVAQLDIAQRGRVVIFCGNAMDARLVHQITQLALALDGADFVEVIDHAIAMPESIMQEVA